MEGALILGGVGISILVTTLKKLFKADKQQTMSMVVILSLAGGLAYYFLGKFGLWESFLQVLVSAGAFYAFILKNMSA